MIEPIACRRGWVCDEPGMVDVFKKKAQPGVFISVCFTHTRGMIQFGWNYQLAKGCHGDKHENAKGSVHSDDKIEGSIIVVKAIWWYL